MEENAGIVRLTAEHNILPFDCGDADLNAVPFYEKNGFIFMGNDERQRYVNGKEDTIAMYFDLKNVAK